MSGLRSFGEKVKVRAVASTAVLLLSAATVRAEPTEDAIAAVGCVAFADSIYAANVELGRTAEGKPDAVHAEWMVVVETLAPELPAADFDALYAEIYPEALKISLGFGREHLAETVDPDSPSDEAAMFVQMIDHCEETKAKALDLPQGN